MEQKNLILGFDFGEKYSQFCCYDRGTHTAVSIPVKEGEEAVEFPTAIAKKRNEETWKTGPDAEKSAHAENGGCVRDKSYPLGYNKIGGYGRPDYSIVPEEDDDMDQAKFNEMFGAAMTNYLKGLQNNNCGDWSEEARVWAESVGLFAGNGTAVDGKPNMMWPSGLTREQAAQLFYRFAQMAGLA